VTDAASVRRVLLHAGKIHYDLVSEIEKRETTGVALVRLEQYYPLPEDQLREVVRAVQVPVQAVGGLSLEQAVQCPQYGAPLVVLGAPLTIDADAFKTADGDLEGSLRRICEAVHAQQVVRP
jgi:2,4-dienoyl-CoA reductase-like NADH-dependent reductase (Old Yellow Enzyme family)